MSLVLPDDPTPLDEAAFAYLSAHRDVWALFVFFTRSLIDAGHAHGGAKAIVERIRWHAMTTAHTGDLEFVLNNSHTASLARIFAASYPAHSLFFRTRSRPTESHRAA